MKRPKQGQEKQNIERFEVDPYGRKIRECEGEKVNETDWDDRVCFYFIAIRIKNEICLSVLDSKKEMN